MSLNVTGILDGIVSHAMALGVFDRVQGHELKNPPGHGLTMAVWVDRIGPQPGGSGLSVTTGRLEFIVRLYSNALQDPADAIDPNLLAAVDVLLAAYSGDFELGGTVRNIDLLGMQGTPLSGRAGYLTISSTMYRIFDITLPVIVNDLWSQSG